MIPRYEPTCNFSDIFLSFYDSSGDDRITKLEECIKKFFGVKYAFILNSGKTALYVILKAYNRPGGVIMPAYNCNVVPEVASYAGYRPVFVDVHPQTMNMPEADLQKYLTDDVSVIFAIHLFGIPCNINSILEQARERNILVVEDAAPAMGAKIDQQLVGTFADASVISFQTTKIVSGETGGAILTDDPELARKISIVLNEQTAPVSSFGLFLMMLARKIATRRIVFPFSSWVYNRYRPEGMYEVLSPRITPPRDFFTRCSPYSVNLILRQWDRLPWNLARRRKIASCYRTELQGHSAFNFPEVPVGADPAWIQFPLLVKNKQHFYSYMRKAGIDNTWTYRYSCAAMYQQPGYPVAEHVARSILSLPVYPSLSDGEVSRICAVAKEYRE